VDVKSSSPTQIFEHQQFGNIRINIDKNGEPLFCLTDICMALELTNPSSVKSRLDADQVQLIDLHTLNYNEGMKIIGNSFANFVNEDGFYDVLLQSSSVKVKPFRKWITSEVLPSIRKHGGYGTIDDIIANPDLGIELLTSLKEERSKRMELESEILMLQEKLEISNGRLNNAKNHYRSEVKPKLEHYDELLKILSKIPLHQKTVTDIMPIFEGDDFLKVTSKIKKTSQGIKNTSIEPINTKDCILVADVPQFLNLPFGRNNFYRELRENGVFMKKRNFPKRKFISKGFFVEEKTKVFATPIGVNFVNHLFNEECQN
jgi:prophage antirepressor-like protein